MFVPGNAALADKGTQPQSQAPRLQPPQIDLSAIKDLPVPDESSLPEVIRTAKALDKSLSPEQRAAGRAVLDRYSAEMDAISKAILAGRDQSGNVEAKPVDKALVARMTAVLGKIESEFAGFLSAEQLAQYRAVMRPQPFSGAVDTLPKLAGPSRDLKPESTPQGYTSYCFYGAYYDSYADYYAYYGYLYAYYDYYYTGHTYAYYAYYYSYLGWSYAITALTYSAPLYFEMYYWGPYMSSWPYYAYYYSYYAKYYQYYGYYYSYYNYYYYGTTRGYYAYLYNYYGYIGTYYAEYNTYYCYYYR
jgi:hypothetical protein